MFVLSVEGPSFLNKGTWATHKVLGVGPTRDEALATAAIEDFDGEDTLLLTDVDTGKVERIDTWSSHS